MRYQTTFLVALLLPATVLLQTLSSSDIDWLNSLTATEIPTTVAAKPAVELSSSTLSPETLDWVRKILEGTDTTTTTTTTTTTQHPNTSNDPDLSPDVDASNLKECTTDEGLDGRCVSVYQCNKEGVIDNTTLIDLRDGSCHYLQRCCLQSDVSRNTPKPPVTVGNSKCGWSNPGASILRIKDKNNINRKTYADYGEYPWMIAVIQKSVGEFEWSQKQYLAGGTLIHPSVVITAAHKVYRFTSDQIKCRAGEWDTQTLLEPFSHQERNVEKMITHEEYFYINYDITMLVLNKPFELQDAPHIGIACLSAQLPQPRNKCYSMGWGDEFGGNKYAVILKKVEVPYVPSDICQEQLRKTRLSPRFTLHSSHICAGGVAGVDTCKGDGGSSLACPIEEGPEAQRFAVYGMVAFGVGCGKPIPAVYVNIPNMLAWIDSMMIKEGFGVSSYRP